MPSLLEMISMDVDDVGSVAEGIRQVVERAGRIDGVVNCAGFGIGGSIEDTDDDEAKAIFETNFFGTLRVCREVLPIMRKQGSGTIVNVSSIGGRIAVPFVGLYGATKFAVEGLTEALRMEVQRFGIRVALVEPGDFATGFTDSRRPARNALENEVYADVYRAALAVIERDERGGASPEAIGRLVARILASRSPRLRYTVGPVLQRVAVRLRSILPAKLFGWALREYYRVG
jgi:NAD(P)-dependent dehydrogenase (short-subunit alcohol dehydrogenase family)